MTKYTIENFWTHHLGEKSTESQKESMSLIKGWSFQNTEPKAFMEAPLTLSSEFGDDCNPSCSSILLVSAPGAVGKSTLAQQIAFFTNSVYIDLAKAEPVGANTLTGGLVNSDLYQYWVNGSITVLIDGLDEARLKVTQEAFQSFLLDVAGRSKDRKVPTVLLGRTGAIQDAWLILTDHCPEIAVFEIGYFGPEESVAFAEIKLQARNKDDSHIDIRKHVLTLLLNQLRSQAESDGDRFSGYAPVLEAVTERVVRASNPSTLIEEINAGARPVTLQNIVQAILKREQGKLGQLSFKQPDLVYQLYSPEEQLDRLVARVYNLSPPELPEMDPKDAHTYSKALETWVAEHPFLDGGTSTSSAVFDAMISTKALLTSAASEKALQKELNRGTAANPFLFKFYTDAISESNDTFIQGDHIGVIYAALRASLSLGDIASLSIEQLTDAEQDKAFQAEVEIAITKSGKTIPRVFRFATKLDDHLIRLGVYVENIDIVVPDGWVEIGPGSEAMLITPINIQCKVLSISTEHMIAKNPPEQQQTAAIFLEATEFEGTSMLAVPVIHGEVTLSAAWPGARTHPWTSFAIPSSHIQDPRVEEALRRFRQFVIAFRAHGGGDLARFKGKIEHARKTKGVGQKVLDLMVNKGILSLRDRMYHLNVGTLTELTGTTYSDCMARCFGSKAIAFVEQALEDFEN